MDWTSIQVNVYPYPYLNGYPLLKRVYNIVVVEMQSLVIGLSSFANVIQNLKIYVVLITN
jgi:hypothetical protein